MRTAWKKNESSLETRAEQKYQHLLSYKVVAVLPARSPLSVNRGRHQQPCSFFFLVSLDRPRGTLQLRHTQTAADTRNFTKWLHSRSNSFFPPFSPQRMHRVYFEDSRSHSENYYQTLTSMISHE